MPALSRRRLADDTLGRKISLTLPDKTTIFYSYDGPFLKAVSYKDYTHTYAKRDLDGHIQESTLPKGLGTTTFTKDACGRLATIKSPDFSATYSSYDPNGNLESYTLSDTRGTETKHFAYDSLNQLILENEHTYRYDSLNNRLEKDGLIHTVNDLCQITSDGASDYTYDANGNTTSDQTWHYTYDQLDHLISAEQDDLKIEYTYDPFHRRLTKTTISARGPPQTLYYLWDGENEIGAVDAEGHLVELRVLGEGLGAEIGSAVLLILEEKAYVPLHDHQGSLVALLDPETKTTQETYRYTAFGEEQTGHTLSPWRFSSKRTDETTGLVYFGRRYYRPKLGRWLTTDPIGFEDGPNLYAYAHNCPTTHFDLYGHFDVAAIVKPVLIWCFRGALTFGFGCSWGHQDYEHPYDYSSYEDNYEKKSRSFDLSDEGRPDPPDNTAITVINGVGNSYSDVRQKALELSEAGGSCNVYGVHNASHRVIADGREAFANKRGACTPPVYKLRDVWIQLLTEKKISRILHYCHSQGAAQTRLALQLLPKELRERIDVVAVAPFAYIPSHLCGAVVHLVSKGDLVHCLDSQVKKQCQGTIIELERHPDAKGFIDHSFNSPTFRRYIHGYLKDFIRDGRLNE